eukprot:scaffold305660_cov17-Tisochrysis_lutea.AAC.1
MDANWVSFPDVSSPLFPPENINILATINQALASLDESYPDILDLVAWKSRIHLYTPTQAKNSANSSMNEIVLVTTLATSRDRQWALEVHLSWGARQNPPSFKQQEMPGAKTGLNFLLLQEVPVQLEEVGQGGRGQGGFQNFGNALSSSPVY